MIKAIADTHTAIWYLMGDSRLSPAARSMIDATASANDQVGISSISLVEIIYLQEKGRIKPTTLATIVATLHRSNAVFVEVPVEVFVVQAMNRVSKSEVPELADRVIGATAVYLGVSVLTRDPDLTNSSVPTIW